MHCWALAGGKNVLTAHIVMKRSDDESKPLLASDIERVHKLANDIV